MSSAVKNPTRGRSLFLQVLILSALLVLGLYSSGLGMAPTTASLANSGGMVEPQAGSWKTWVLDSGDQLRLPAPPDKNTTKTEIEELMALAAGRDVADLDHIAYWTAGPPVYRWNRLAVDMGVDKNASSPVMNRHLALLNTALADAMVAAWDSKYAYMRPRPSQFDKKVVAVIPVPDSPSYPSEHAVAAGAAARVLAALFPDKAAEFAAKEAEAAQAIMLSGTQYPSDIEAGLDLGHQVADLAIAYAASDRFNLPWTGTVPTDPTGWTGTNPALPQAAGWRTWVLQSADEFRPAAPYAYGSPELEQEMQYLRDQVRDGRMTAHGFFWEHGAGGVRNFWFWNDHLARMVQEYDLNAPRAARAYAFVNVALHDATVACWDAKYTYWGIRPSQYDPSFQTLFPNPNHPSYPSAHSCLSMAAADVLAYLFPANAAEFHDFAEEAGDARIWAGIHFPNDITVGEQLAHDVAGKVIEYAESDGSQ